LRLEKLHALLTGGGKEDTILVFRGGREGGRAGGRSSNRSVSTFISGRRGRGREGGRAMGEPSSAGIDGLGVVTEGVTGAGFAVVSF